MLALGTSSIAATAAIAIGRSPTWDLLLMAYLFSFGAYSINRATDFEEDKESHIERTSHLASRRRALPYIAGGSFLAGYILASMRSFYLLVALILPLLLALGYSMGSKRMSKAFGISRLKEGLLVKNLTISLGWSLIPLLVGLYFLEAPLSVFALSSFVFVRLMVNTIFFDVRDVETDTKFGIRTLPSAIGMNATSKTMEVLDVGSAALVTAFAATGLLPQAMFWLVVFTPYSFTYRWFSSRLPGRQDALRDVAADGEYVLWALVATVGQV